MVELAPRNPLQGETPVEIGQMVIEEITGLGPITSIAPYPGRQTKVSDILKRKHGLTWPQPNEHVPGESARCLWFGREMALLIGAKPDAALGKQAALTDQSDAWTLLSLRGAGVEEVLARLCPLEVRLSRFPVNRTARTEFAHMMGSLTRLSEAEFQIMVFRAFARTALHKMTDAMEGVAARAGA